MVGGDTWPVLGIQLLNHFEHATKIIADATALLELGNTKRAKLSAQSLKASQNSVIILAKKTTPIVEDITLIKDAVNNALISPAPHHVVRSGTPSYPSTPNSRASTTAVIEDRETVVRLDVKAAAVLRKVSPEDLRRLNQSVREEVLVIRMTGVKWK
ncbi:uncharacterized protein BDW43DRAFT_322423 [Aspergillus alliaceus]|uniref:uncharacterized protein n=1 Tax=Petromyces alliaceus TaxID=209559 RepID=UPI0012A457BB|nr:uncharacterized protein BDW43DRAFT_322423 [Aspergillus alliaceus]KAB8228992.1 hypothetical protein BDW43DRAFT_322423 [Aspergillus alliaceus]